MNNNYEKEAVLVKAIADPNRLKILDILSCGEQCACDILENFEFTQPTLSHHMKILIECGLVASRKNGLWTMYSINIPKANQLIYFLLGLITPTEDCICKNSNNSCKCEKGKDVENE